MRLLIVTATIMTSFLAVTMIFYRMRYRRYPGFGQWTAGTIIIAVAHLALALRGLIPLSWSILGSNMSFVLGFVLYLDGMRRFLNLSRLPLIWYALPAAEGAFCAYFYFIQDSTALRIVAFSAAFAIPHITTIVLVLRHMNKEKLLFYPIIAIEMGLANIAILGRAAWVTTVPGFIFYMESPVQDAFFIVILVMLIAVTLSFIMLNNERLEKELFTADKDLKIKVGELEKAMSEVKALGGLLPICASCKKICDDKGKWHQIEAYISERSEADFSHGICPECARKLYPDYWDRKGKA
ncbi:MAG TPA: hypothetical protein VGJ94_17980 [Syntrophorhabdaceae bacterium]|jgi:hypothetical protein